MVHAAQEKSSEIKDVLGPSRWVNVQGHASTKWWQEEGDCVVDFLKQLHSSEIQDPDIYIISPFRIVAQEMRKFAISQEGLLSRWSNNPWSWANTRIGTVHTFQGKEAEAVVFLLGAPNPDQSGARNWAGFRPNLINVAATRAKSVLYVVGAKEQWKGRGHFEKLAQSI